MLKFDKGKDFANVIWMDKNFTYIIGCFFKTEKPTIYIE